MSCRFVVLLFLQLCLQVGQSLAQQYPVQVTTLLTPPYSLYLSDYTRADRPALQLILHLKELDRSEYRVRLRITIEGAGITLRTRASYLPPPIVLQGGLLETFTGDQLKGYFHPENFDYSGITYQQLVQRGSLPEGFYTFQIQVIDYYRDAVVSNTSIANAWLMLNDPPLINLPFNNEKLVACDPQNIMFSWTPRHTASPNAAFTTEYEFKLVELWPADRNPNDAMLSSNSIYETITELTSLNYSATEPLLIPGRKYAFRIRAYDTEGRDLFKNNGASEVYTFQYGDACPAPGNVNEPLIEGDRFKVTWDEMEPHTSYRLEYKRKSGQTWVDHPSTQVPWAIVPDLTPHTEYEYRLRGYCQTIASEWVMGEVTTTGQTQTATACDAPPSPPRGVIGTNPLLTPLRIGDVVKSAAFDVTLTEVTKNANGTYRGLGFGPLALARGASVRVKFYNIRVNDKYELYEGHFTTVYSKDSRFVMSLDAAKKDLEKERQKEEKRLQEEQAEEKANTEQIIVTGEIGQVTVTGDQITVTKTDGTTQTVERKKNDKGEYKNVELTDEKGNHYTVDKNGNVTEGPSTATPNVVLTADQANFTVTFAAANNQQYGFDAKGEVTATYEQTTIQGSTYNIAWKSVAKDQQDVVDAVVESGTFPESVGFRMDGEEMASQKKAEQPSRKSVWVKGKSSALKAYVRVKGKDDKEEEREVGRLNVVKYEPVWNKVYIVPLGKPQTPTAEELTRELNKVYGQAVATWSVEVKPEYTIAEDQLSSLDEGSSELLTSYPQPMLSVMRTYRNDPQVFVDQQAYYIFLVNRKGTNRNGYMPLGRRVGFVFAQNLGKETTIRTIAHELGHGAFGLRHTFSNEDQRADEGTTDNLMDYNAGTKLLKYQWDQIHEPPRSNSWWEGDEEGAMSLPCWGWFDDCDDVLAILAGIKSRVSQPNSTLPVFKPDAAKNRGQEYVAVSIKVDGEEYNRILIKNEIKEDSNVDPRVYYDVDAKENNKQKAGFMFKAADNSFFKVFITNELDSATTFNRREKLRKYLFGNVMPAGVEKTTQATDELAKQRAEIANRIDNSDLRPYGRFVEPERLTDNYVDCAEFVYEVLTEQGFQISSGDCIEHSKWYKSRELEGLCLTGTDVNEVKVGDVLLWTGNWENAKEYAHTGIVVYKAENTIQIVNAGNQGCYCDTGWMSYKVKNKDGVEVQLYENMEECYEEKCKKPAVWKSESYFDATTLNSKDHPFKYWARPRK